MLGISMVQATRRGVLRTVGAASVFGLVGVTHAQNGPQEISACTVIDEPGEYVLTQDLDSHSDSPCIHITADDVVLDGNGYRIDDLYPTSVLVTGDYVTIENLGSYSGGVDFEGTTGAIVRNSHIGPGNNALDFRSSTEALIENNFLEPAGAAVFLRDSHDCIIRKNTLWGDSGAVLWDSTGNHVDRNEVLGGFSGVTVAGEKNHVTRNHVHLHEWNGILLWRGANHTHVAKNLVEKTDSGPGISLEGVHGNRLLQNEVVNNGETPFSDEFGWGGIYLEDADRNHLIRNTVCDNWRGDIVIDSESTGNRLVKNETEC